MTRILYLVHDLDDPAVWRRENMLRLSGASVDLVGFRRGEGPLPGPATVLGRTRNAKMAQRAAAVLRQRLRPDPALVRHGRPDAIVARNLEMLALAVPLRRRLADGRRIPLVYEVLDIHRLMVGSGTPARLLRGIERRLCRDVDRLLVSSPAFLREHFEAHGQYRAPATLVENKVPAKDAPERPPRTPERQPEGPIRIGWFGMLRCKVSLHLLDALTRAQPGRYRVILRGRPALDAIPDFHDCVADNPDLEFGGTYAYPDDLPRIYGAVDLAWLVDRYDAGANSDWLLPNRLYESGLNGVPPIALAGTEIAARVGELGIGTVLEEATEACTRRTLDALPRAAIEALRDRQLALPVSTWTADEAECRALLAAVAGDPDPAPVSGEGVLIVVPTLQEARHVRGVLDGLLPCLRRLHRQGRPARLVVADGGSDDGTCGIVEEVAADAGDLDIRLMHNPERLQSAGINRAVAEHGAGMTWLVRLDAHAVYPDAYVETLLDEARRTGAESVVVAMRAVGTAPMQRLIALTQNSRIGNGGSAHRTCAAGRFVDHGHHALMRLEAFRTVGGYDPGFSHNEDAELDLRLAQAGHRLWLTTRTGLDYLPRRGPGALMRQYFRFGRGRARTILKHRIRPRLRQIAMIVVAPLVALAVLAPLHPVFALPGAVWALACLAGGFALAIGLRRADALAAGPMAALMHLAWSAGFWRQLATGHDPRPAQCAPEPEDTPIPAGAVAIGVCTFRRPALTETLATLEAQDLPPGITASIIVADNDTMASARETVEVFAAHSRHEVIYRHAPAGNISIARNAVLDEAEQRGLARLAFIDDDESAPPSWLRALLARLAQGDAEVVVGPVRATYAPQAPRWMQRRRVHDTRPELGPDGRPIAGHSCNVAMNLSAAALRGRRFDLARGVSGGEDTAFFDAARRAGARLGFAPAALLEEPVSASRARLGWLLKRRYRMGQTHGGLLGAGRGPAARLTEIARAMAKVAYCAFGALLTAPFSGLRNGNLIRGALHAGTASALLGLRDVAIYGDGIAEEPPRQGAG